MPSTTVRRAVDAVTLGRRRRARAMNRRLAKLDRLEFGVHPVRRSRPRGVSLAFVVLLLVVVGGFAVWQSGVVPGPKGAAASASSIGLTDSGSPQIVGAPTTTHLADRHRLLPAVTDAPSSTAYRFLYGTRAIRWEHAGRFVTSFVMKANRRSTTACCGQRSPR